MLPLMGSTRNADTFRSGKAQHIVRSIIGLVFGANKQIVNDGWPGATVGTGRKGIGVEVGKVTSNDALPLGSGVGKDGLVGRRGNGGQVELNVKVRNNGSGRGLGGGRLGR
jgi:hypothetical protein